MLSIIQREREPDKGISAAVRMVREREGEENMQFLRLETGLYELHPIK